MMAQYCTLNEIKGDLNITDDTYDNTLAGMIEAASQAIDNYCDRQFATVTEARYFDGAGPTIFIDDLVSVTTFKLDEDGDGTFEATLAATDYVLYPLNKTPKTYAKISNDSDYGSFASGIKNGVEITGVWGYQSTVPEAIRRATLMLASRLFKRKDSAYASVVATTELGQFEVFRGMDSDMQMILAPYRRRRV